MTKDIFRTESDAAFMLDHDEVCMLQASQLLAMGCMEYEAAAYGCAYMDKGERHYYISSREESMNKFRQKACLEQIYHTPVEYFCRRYDLLDESEEEINARFRMETAQLLDRRYPKVLFEAIEELNQAPCANDGFPILQEMAALLENTFDLPALGLFAHLLEMLLLGRRVNHAAYQIMRRWLEAEYEKNAVEPLHCGAYKRQYAGFAYAGEGKTGYFMDALPHLVQSKQAAYIARGYVVTPILTETYYADAFVLPQTDKAHFKKAMDRYLGDGYLKLMVFLHALPATINAGRYHELAAELQAVCTPEAQAAFKYYGHLCNVW